MISHQVSTPICWGNSMKRTPGELTFRHAGQITAMEESLLGLYRRTQSLAKL